MKSVYIGQAFRHYLRTPDGIPDDRIIHATVPLATHELPQTNPYYASDRVRVLYAITLSAFQILQDATANAHLRAASYQHPVVETVEVMSRYYPERRVSQVDVMDVQRKLSSFVLCEADKPAERGRNPYGTFGNSYFAILAHLIERFRWHYTILNLTDDNECNIVIATMMLKNDRVEDLEYTYKMYMGSLHDESSSVMLSDRDLRIHIGVMWSQSHMLFTAGRFL